MMEFMLTIACWVAIWLIWAIWAFRFSLISLYFVIASLAKLIRWFGCCPGVSISKLQMRFFWSKIGTRIVNDHGTGKGVKKWGSSKAKAKAATEIGHDPVKAKQF